MATTDATDKTVSTSSQQTKPDDPTCACESPYGDLPCFKHYQARRRLTAELITRFEADR